MKKVYFPRADHIEITERQLGKWTKTKITKKSFRISKKKIGETLKYNEIHVYIPRL